MKCTVAWEDFRPAWKAMLPPGATDHIHAWDVNENWDENFVRIEASNGRLTLECPFGRSSLPAQVERPGVVFYPLARFCERTARVYCDETEFDFDANPEYFVLNSGRTYAIHTAQAVFDDPATAPRTFTPEVTPQDDGFDDDFEDDEAADAVADGAAGEEAREP